MLLRAATKVVSAAPGLLVSPALRAAAQLGLTVDVVDRSAGYLLLLPSGGMRRLRRLSVSLTDSGTGATAIHAAWESPGAPNSLLPSSRLPARIIRQIVRNMASQPSTGEPLRGTASAARRRP